ncbi:DNA-formamidopyrimidine glycosylase [Patescibacteria group bacterium]|nr:DNA-formamidopyrimidine glycosylase [Patescibacteria group bacterium]
MPELPEVETIKSQLNQLIRGKKIEKVEVRLPKLVKYPIKEFKRLVEGKKIVGVSRRGKLLIFELSDNCFLVVHLKMSGQLIYNGEIGKHTHLIYYFTDGSYLVHNDLRQFGYVKAVDKKGLAGLISQEKLGPEPLTKEFSLELFKKLLNQRKKSKIKTLLMDQTFIVGIGNIYASEILFQARVSPLRKVEMLKAEEIKKIYRAIKNILKLAIKMKGSSANDYLDARGKRGSFLSMAKVYQKEGKKCLNNCGGRVKRLKMNTRSTFYCSKCQK